MVACQEPPQTSEAPDRILRVDGVTVGLEHTQFFYPTSPGRTPAQQTDSLTDLAVEQARRLFRERGGPALYVYPIVNSERGPHTKRRAYQIAEVLADLVHRNGWGARYEDRMYETWREIPEIHGYTVMPSVDGTDELWSAGGGGWVATVEPQHVQAALDAKNALYPTYAARVEEVWLLIVNDMVRGGNPCELGGPAEAADYTFSFDRAFWLELIPGRVIELAKA